MRCKKHLTDLSSSVGVCSSCLRERLFALVAAQAHVQVDRRKTDPNPPPITFPRSASPHMSRQKSENAVRNFHRHNHSLPDQRFYSTPQVGPTGVIAPSISCKKKHSKFSLFSSMFRSKSEKTDLDPRISNSNSRDSCQASSPSQSWFSSIIHGRRKKQSRLFSIDESTATGDRKQCGNRDRGMSPARYSDDGDQEESQNGSGDFSSEWTSKQTPGRAAPTARRGGGRPTHGRNASGLSFCLSPLVRASPNRNWNQKGMPPEMAVSGEVRVPVKPHLSTAASFCANRSRKLADFGRFNQNQGLR